MQCLIAADLLRTMSFSCEASPFLTSILCLYHGFYASRESDINKVLMFYPLNWYSLTLPYCYLTFVCNHATRGSNKGMSYFQYNCGLQFSNFFRDSIHLPKGVAFMYAIYGTKVSSFRTRIMNMHAPIFYIR